MSGGKDDLENIWLCIDGTVLYEQPNEYARAEKYTITPPTPVDTIAVPREVIEVIAKLCWNRDYPNGGSMYKTYESLPFNDLELYRKEAESLLHG